MRSRAASVLVLASAVAAIVQGTGCAPDPKQLLYMTVERYLAGVQQRDDQELSYLWAPYQRETFKMSDEEKNKALTTFKARIRKANHTYDQERREGSLPPADPLGVILFRALGLGKGATSLPLSGSIDEGGATARVRTRVITNLETLHLDSLPTGVRVYLMGYPFGNVEMIAVGYDEPSKHRLLESVDIDWVLSRPPEKVWSPAGWLIESLSPDPNSATEWKQPAK